MEADDGEFRIPPTAHFIATVEDLTDMLDYDSEDIDGMDDDAGEEEAQNPPFTGRWTTTSPYDVYMVDAPKDNSGDDKEKPVEDDPPKTQPKRRHQRRRSKSRRSKDSSTDTGEDNTPEGAEDNEDPVGTTNEQDEWEGGHVSSGKQAMHEDLEDSKYLPLSEDEASLGTKDFIMPEEPLEQERFNGLPARSLWIAGTIRPASVTAVQPHWSSTQSLMDSTSRASSWMVAAASTHSIRIQSAKWALIRQESSPQKLPLKVSYPV